MSQITHRTGGLVMLGVFCGLAWWAVIEGVIWIGSNISLEWIA
jgi:hypothetical protein